jgi:dienelactone hydrolase
VIRQTFVREWTPGDPIRGDVRIPDGPLPRTAIVVVHGFKGFKDWGFFPHVCDRLTGAGHSVVSFNLSHNGVGADLENFTELDRFGANTLTRELDEVLFIVDHVAEGDLTPGRPQRIGILGHSRGGGQAILAAGEEERIVALATWGAVSHFDRWTEETKDEWRAQGRTWVLNSRTGQQMPLDVGLLEDFEANRERLDVLSGAARLERPWLIAHGTDDPTVSVEEARTLARVAPSARLLLVDGAGHTFEARHPFTAGTPELDRVVEATIAHFAKHLSV